MMKAKDSSETTATKFTSIWWQNTKKINKKTVSPSSSSSFGATTLGGLWPALRFRSTIFYLYTSLSNFSLSSSLNPLLLGQAISILVFLLVLMNMVPIQLIFLTVQTNSQHIYYMLLFRCNTGYANAPQCYFYSYMACFVLNWSLPSCDLYVHIDWLIGRYRSSISQGSM